MVFSFTLSFCYILKYSYDAYCTKKESNLLDELSLDNVVPEEIPEAVMIEKTERMLKLEELRQQNSDIVAWIEIENTNINYPVLQGTDNNFYFNHNYEKKYTIYGSIFLDASYSWNPPSANLLIYGHHMKNGSMFQNLLKYKKKEFYEQHPTIRFTTINEDVYYEIIAVFESKIYNSSDKDVFKYYYFIDAANEDAYNDFVQNAKNASLYDTGKTAHYGEQLMTLSTCAYHTKNGRFAVVAKRINNESN